MTKFQQEEATPNYYRSQKNILDSFQLKNKHMHPLLRKGTRYQCRYPSKESHIPTGKSSAFRVL